MNFSIIGPTGYIGKRHLEAIEHHDGSVISYLDINKSIELQNSKYFKDQNEFFDSFDNLKPDYCVICSPNYLHFSQVIASLEKNVNVICEKPLCTSNLELSKLISAEDKSSASIFSIMQLRLHPVTKRLRNISLNNNSKKTAEIRIVTPRDKSYLESWKVKKIYSGGILFNLGIHYFDLLINAFGDVLHTEIDINEQLKSSGKTAFKDLEVDWFFSIDPDDQGPDLKPMRTFKINNEEINFHKVANDLHYDNYDSIFNNSELFDLPSVLPIMRYMCEINEK